MSWFKRKPPKYPPLPKSNQTPHRTSPAADKAMEEAKQTGVSSSSKKR
jgi:hypothetical protein